MTTYLKQDDNHPVSFKVNMDLTGSVGTLVLRNRRDKTVTQYVLSVSDAANGIFEWDYDGTLSADAYLAEIEISRDGEKMTAPSQGYYDISVQCDLNEDD